MDEPVQTINASTKKIPIQHGAEPNTIMVTVDGNGEGERRTIQIPRPLRTVAVNMMEYEDGEGVKHRIYLPQGTAPAACDHLENKRWDELAKFEPYTNQGYTEDDFKKSEEFAAQEKQNQESSNV